MAEHHEGLIYAMVLASAADREMTDSELQSMGDMVRNLPVFDGFNEEDSARRDTRLRRASQ